MRGHGGSAQRKSPPYNLSRKGRSPAEEAAWLGKWGGEGRRKRGETGQEQVRRGEATTGPRVPPFREYQGKENNGGLGGKK